MKNLLVEIQKIANNTHDSIVNQKVAASIVALHNSGKKINIKNISALAFVSSASVTRFCQKMGFSGVSEVYFNLKESIPESLNQNKGSFFNDVISNNFKNIWNSNKDIINLLAQSINKTKKVYLFGGGSNAHIINNFKHLLNRMGCMAVYASDSYDQKLISSKVSKDSTIIVLSYIHSFRGFKETMANIIKSENKYFLISSKNFKNNSNEYLIKLYDNEIVYKDWFGTPMSMLYISLEVIKKLNSFKN